MAWQKSALIKIRNGPVQQRDMRAIKSPGKKAALIYGTPEHKAWRAQVIKRAGGRCECVEDGKRCTRAEPLYRLYADHIRELKDGGAPFDLANGRALCSSHHTSKTLAERDNRFRRVPKRVVAGDK